MNPVPQSRGSAVSWWRWSSVSAAARPRDHETPRPRNNSHRATSAESITTESATATLDSPVVRDACSAADVLESCRGYLSPRRAAVGASRDRYCPLSFHSPRLCHRRTIITLTEGTYGGEQHLQDGGNRW